MAATNRPPPASVAAVRNSAWQLCSTARALRAWVCSTCTHASTTRPRDAAMPAQTAPPYSAGVGDAVVTAASGLVVTAASGLVVTAASGLVVTAASGLAVAVVSGLVVAVALADSSPPPPPPSPSLMVRCTPPLPRSGGGEVGTGSDSIPRGSCCAASMTRQVHSHAAATTGSSSLCTWTQSTMGLSPPSTTTSAALAACVRARLARNWRA